MAEPTFEASQSGIRLSYLRFMADSAVGLFAIFCTVIAYYATPTAPFLQGVLFHKPGTEAKVFLLIIALLLATPFGLLVNAASWFLMGWWQTALHDWLITTKWAFRVNKRDASYEFWQKEFQDPNEDIRTVIELVDTAANLYFPEVGASLTHVRGAHRLFRSLSFLGFVAIAGWNLRVLWMEARPWFYVEILWLPLLLGLGFLRAWRRRDSRDAGAVINVVFWIFLGTGAIGAAVLLARQEPEVFRACLVIGLLSLACFLFSVMCFAFRSLQLLQVISVLMLRHDLQGKMPVRTALRRILPKEGRQVAGG